MDSEPADHRPATIHGQLLRASRHRVVAIYLRDGMICVAEFIDGRGRLVDVNAWFRFNCGTRTNEHAMRRMVLESAVPLPDELIEPIEALHRAAAAQKKRA